MFLLNQILKSIKHFYESEVWLKMILFKYEKLKHELVKIIELVEQGFEICDYIKQQPVKV